MARITHILIASTYSMMALFLCAMLIRFNLAEIGPAWTLSAVLGLTAGQVHAIIARETSRDGIVVQMRTLAETKHMMADEMAALRDRIAQIEESVAQDSNDRHDEIVADVRSLEDLVHELGDRIGENARMNVPSRNTHAGPNGDRAQLLSTVRDALAEGRVDLHLQPIVSLPQRKTHFFESFSRLRDADGGVVMPAEWLRVAEPAGLVSEIDNLLLFRCVQIVRRLAEKERRVGIFCNISQSSLSDDEFFPQFLDFVRRNSDLAGSLIFEIGQAAFQERGLTAARNMARLADFGFRFSIDKVTDLDFDLPDIRRAGVKFIKAPGELLVQSLKAGEPLGLSAAPEINAEDYPSLLAKFGVELIAEKIEDEATILQLLDLDVGLAQGHLFGPPRPIRDDILAEAAPPKEEPREGFNAEQELHLRRAVG